MELKTMQTVLNDLAVEKGYSSLKDLTDNERGYCTFDEVLETVDDFYQEAIKLYALQIAEAACKEQRAICVDAYSNTESGDSEDFIYNASSPDIDKLLK